MQELLLKHCPLIYSLFEKDTRIWKRVDKVLLRYEALETNPDFEGKLQFHCLYDWLLLAELGDKKAKDFLIFVEKIIKELFIQTEKPFQNTLKSTVGEILKAFDTDITLPNNPSYLNYLGELIGLQAITDPANFKFQLNAREFLLSNRSKIDFQFLDRENSNLALVDFFSIHGLNLDKISSPNELEEHLITRFNRKLESKTQNQIENKNRIVFEDGTEQMLAILPIIWYEPSDLKPYSQVFKDLEANTGGNVLPCCSLLTSIDEDGNYVFEFIKLSSL